MDNVKLIIVEGLPGSGKSTTANLIADILSKKGKKVVCMDEGIPNHPADYDNYDFDDFKTEREQILKKWREFVATADTETIYVFNCIFLQNPMCETMMRFGMSEEKSCRYICEIADIIKPMNPLIFYLKRVDVRKTIQNVLKERGNDWLNFVIDYHINQGYGKNKELLGFDGYIKCLEERQTRELNILEMTGLNSMILNEYISADDFLFLFKSVGWTPPSIEQIQIALQNTTKSFILKANGQPIAMINLLGDFGMHWLLKEFVVHPDYQGKMIGTMLFLFAENYVKSTLKDGWKVAITLRSSNGKEEFYKKLGFYECTHKNVGNGMEKIIICK